MGGGEGVGLLEKELTEMLLPKRGDLLQRELSQ